MFLTGKLIIPLLFTTQLIIPFPPTPHPDFSAHLAIPWSAFIRRKESWFAHM